MTESAAAPGPTQRAGTAQIGPVEIAYETLGRPGAPAVVLVAGLARQLVSWPDALCRALADRGLFVVRFDNRDAGASTHLVGAPPPDLRAVTRGDYASVSYRLTDMAADVVGLLDVLGLPAAALVGHSMGGMIAQTVVIEYPDRVRGLVSLSSAPGVRDPWDARREALPVVLEPPPTDRTAYIEQAVRFERLIAVPPDVDGARKQAQKEFARGVDPEGKARQFVAMHASGDRTHALAACRTPALVVHGALDPLIGVRAAHATAAALPGARLLVFAGMGHELSRGHWPEFIDAVGDIVVGGRS